MLVASILLAQTLQQSARPPRSIAGPAAVVLLKDGCPCARECHVALNSIASACRGKVRFVGLLDGDEKKAGALTQDAELRFPIMSDPHGATIRALGGREALDLRLVGKDGRVVARWNGLSRAHVAVLVDAVHAQTGRDVSLDLAPFTTLVKLGCAF